MSLYMCVSVSNKHKEYIYLTCEVTEGEEGEIFYSLTSSLNGSNGSRWNRLKVKVQKSIQASHAGVGVQVLDAFSTGFPGTLADKRIRS